MFIVALFTTAKSLKQPECPSVDEWIKEEKKKEWYINTMEYYTSAKKKKLLNFATA